MNKYEEELNYAIENCHDTTLLGLQELVELHTPKKVIEQNNGIKRCPNCSKYADDVVNGFQFEFPHCKYCGQALDWSVDK